MASFTVETKSYTGQWKAFPSTRPLTRSEAEDEIRFARAMGVTGPLRIVETAEPPPPPRGPATGTRPLTRHAARLPERPEPPAQAPRVNC